jgi:hypothetical protein
MPMMTMAETTGHDLTGLDELDVAHVVRRALHRRHHRGGLGGVDPDGELDLDNAAAAEAMLEALHEAGYVITKAR